MVGGTAVRRVDFGKGGDPPDQSRKESPVNDTLIPPTTIPVNDNPPIWKEADQPNMREAVATALGDIEIMLDWADEAVVAAATVVERARGADPEAVNEIDAVVSTLNAIRYLFAGARGSFETIPFIAN